MRLSVLMPLVVLASGCLHPVGIDRGRVLEDCVVETPSAGGSGPRPFLVVVARGTTLEVVAGVRTTRSLAYEFEWEQFIVAQQHPLAYELIDVFMMGYGLLFVPLYGGGVIDQHSLAHFLVWEVLGIFNPLVCATPGLLIGLHNDNEVLAVRLRDPDATIRTLESRGGLGLIEAAPVVRGCAARGGAWHANIALDAHGRGRIVVPAGVQEVQVRVTTAAGDVTRVVHVAQ